MAKHIDRPDPPASHIGATAETVGVTPEQLSNKLFGELPSWKRCILEGQRDLEAGDNVIILRSREEWYSGVPEEKKGWRSAPNTVGPLRPPQFFLYELENQSEKELGDYRIYWNPNDFVEEDDWNKLHQRKRRAPWRVWEEEVTAPGRMPLAALQAFAFHSEFEKRHPDLARPLRLAWKEEVLSEHEAHTLQVIAQRLGVDPEECLFDLWGGALSWRVHHDFADLPRPDSLQVLRVQQHVHSYLEGLSHTTE